MNVAKGLGGQPWLAVHMTVGSESPPHLSSLKLATLHCPGKVGSQNSYSLASPATLGLGGGGGGLEILQKFPLAQHRSLRPIPRIK